MKKFLLNRFSKRSLFGIFFVLLMMIFFIILGNSTVVYASGGSGTFFENSSFSVDSIYNDGSSVFLEIRSKLGTYGNNGYIRHLNFEECTGTLDGVTDTYSLTLTNSSSTGYYYSTREIYVIDDLSLTSGMNFKFLSIGEYDVSSSNLYFNTVANGLKTLKWATAYAYIYFTDQYNLAVPNYLFQYCNYASIFFNLYVDGVGQINPSQLNSLRFEFKDDNSNYTVVSSSFENKWTYSSSSNYSWYDGFFLNEHNIYYSLPKYEYSCSEPSRTDGLSNKFDLNLFGADSISSDVLDKARNNNEFKNWSNGISDNFNYCLQMIHCPKLNKGATKTNSNVDTFAVLQFSYWEDDVNLIGASLYDTENPIYVVQDENGNDKVVTINSDGEIIDSNDYSVNEYGVVINNETGEEVHAFDRNDVIAKPDNPSIWDTLGSTFKTIFTIALGIIALLIILKIISLVVKIFKNKK